MPFEESIHDGITFFLPQEPIELALQQFLTIQRKGTEVTIVVLLLKCCFHGSITRVGGGQKGPRETGQVRGEHFRDSLF